MTQPDPLKYYCSSDRCVQRSIRYRKFLFVFPDLVFGGFFGILAEDLQAEA